MRFIHDQMQRSFVFAQQCFGEVGEETRAFADTQFEVRAFAAPIGVPEDPVTGSLNASLAQWLMAEGIAPTQYVAAQGACLGRARAALRTASAGEPADSRGDDTCCRAHHARAGR